MKFFIDTADIDAIRAWQSTGLIDGVTTNPTLAAKAGREFLPLIEDICACISGPVSAEVTATEAEIMVREARTLAAIAPNVAVKVPLTRDGLKACRTLSDEGVRVNVTLCFSPAQAILAAKAGAAFVSPFVGRLDDIGTRGMELIADVMEIYGNYPAFATEVIVASIRHPVHVVEAARIGADIATVPPEVLDKMYNHPLTDRGVDAFLADWGRLGQSILDPSDTETRA